MIKKDNIEELDTLFSCGLTPNACNSFGQSLVHMVCRLGHFQMLQVLMDHGCNLQISDEHGRTPLHDICW
jgi:ankyrin repeat protein